MTINTLGSNAPDAKNVNWKSRLAKAFLIVCLGSLLIYLSWRWQHVYFYVLIGLIMMGISYVLPFRKIDAPLEFCWDLFALVMTLAVFLQICDIAVNQPSVNALLSVAWIQRFHAWAAQWPLWALVIGNYLLGDFIAYWAHRLLHTRRFWPTHAFHHSAKHLNWMSGMRSTLIHDIGVYFPYAVVWVFFPTPKAGMIATGLLIFEIANIHYTHSNIRFPLQRQLEWLFVTPRFHFVHHSANRAYADSNYGFVFSLWDRLFGTYTDPDTVDPATPLGLGYEVNYWRLLIGLPKA